MAVFFFILCCPTHFRPAPQPFKPGAAKVLVHWPLYGHLRHLEPTATGQNAVFGPIFCTHNPDNMVRGGQTEVMGVVTTRSIGPVQGGERMGEDGRDRLIQPLTQFMDWRERAPPDLARTLAVYWLN